MKVKRKNKKPAIKKLNNIQVKNIIIILVAAISFTIIFFRLQKTQEPMIKEGEAVEMTCETCFVQFPFIDFDNNNELTWHPRAYACSEEHKSEFMDNLVSCIWEFRKIEECGSWDLNYDEKVDAGDISAFPICCACSNPTATPTPTPATIWFDLDTTPNSPPGADGNATIYNITEDARRKRTKFSIKGSLYRLEANTKYKVYALRDGTPYGAAGTPVITTDGSGYVTFDKGPIYFNGERREIERVGVWKYGSPYTRDRSNPYKCYDVYKDVACLLGIKK